MASFPSRFGTDSTALDLFLKVYAGEVLQAFEDKNVMGGLTRVRNISSGKDAQFPVVGTASAAYHAIGENILTETSGTTTNPKYLSRPGAKEKVISIDNKLTSNVLIADLDEAMSHFDVRAPYARAQGFALAEKYDLSLMQVCFHGSETTGVISGEGSWGAGGTQITDADFETDLASLKATIRDAAKELDEADVPPDDRHFVLRPAAYHLLASDADVYDSGTTSGGFANPVGLGMGGTGGSVGMGRVLMYQGFNIHMSNRITDLRALGNVTAAETGQRGTDYTGDFTVCVGLFFQREGLGTVKLMDLSLQQEYMIEYQATLMVARFSVGHGVLHEAACGSVVTSA